MSTLTPEQIDEVLPQTQCGLCGYGGCLPYATALANHEAPIDLCPPGGVATLQALATLLQQDATPYLETMAAKTKPKLTAIINEAECIGCTKCIQVCPVDAILGSAKKMHSILSDECTGCELCIAPCPVDCIAMLPAQTTSPAVEKFNKHRARNRYHARNKRLALKQHQPATIPATPSQDLKKNYLQAALARARNKQAK